VHEVQAKVLFLDHERSFRSAISRELRSVGFTVDEFCSAQDAEDALKVDAYDLVLLDRRTPGADGLDVCRRIRRSGYVGTIVCFTQYDSEEDELCTLKAGADALISKGVGVRLLAERLRAHIRRPQRPAPRESGTTRCLPAVEVLYEPVPKLRVAGRAVELTRIEERLFACLHGSALAVVSLECLRSSGWPDQGVLPNTVHKHVSSLRTKLAGTGWVVENLRGLGYRLRPEVTTEDGPDQYSAGPVVPKRAER
jgi:DNA-binding response OmpR family regulator